MRQCAFVLMVFLLALAACATPRTASPVPDGTSPAVEMPAAEQALASGTDEPTASPVPTATYTPTPVPTSTATPVPTDTPTPTPTSTPTPTLPPVVGPKPSYRVAAFYYPWYRNPDVDQDWAHWDEPWFDPPLSISSDYYPLLGTYSNLDPAVVAEHFAWLREAGVGLIISSWWGRTSIEEKAVPLLLEMGERYGIKIAFHLEPYGGRTADRLVRDVQYLYGRYGAHPAFFRTTASSRWSPDDRPKGLFFVWASRFPDTETPAVEASYWREALDTIHAQEDGGLVIADEIVSDWVDGGHFDGLYSYAVLQFDEGDAYSWARALPPDAWFVPGVNPGFSAVRIGYAASTYVPRRGGAAYDERWRAALEVGVEPALMAITSFNEWHEGTQIEPAAVGVTDGRGYTYEDYGPLPPEGYLTLTRQWVDRFLATTWPESYRVRFRLMTTSDWTTFGLVDGATWFRPSVVAASEGADYAGPERDRFLLAQPLARAEDGGMVEMVVDILLTSTESGETLVFEIERGHLGATQVELWNYLGDEPVLIETLEWAGIKPSEPNAHTFQIPGAVLLNPAP